MGTNTGAIRKVREQYDELAPEYDRRWSRYVERSIEETLRRLPSIGSGNRILDAGSGTGALLRRFAPEVKAVGVDLSPAMLSVAQQRAASTLVTADVARLPFASEAFDGAVSASSFHYWPDPPAALGELSRCMKRNAWLVVTDWCDDFLSCKVCDLWLRWRDPAHRRTYGGRDLVKFLRDAGFADVKVERYRISPLWGLMTASARKE